jgi:hypothetical protein
MKGDKSIINVRVPLFGQQSIELYEMSKYVYKKLKEDKYSENEGEESKKGEISRLKNKVMHLGVLHEIGDVPKFSRWNHITTMLILIDKLSKDVGTIHSLDINLKSNAKLKSSKELEVSVEDLLKSWAILYSIGHLVGTFTTEHALLKYIVKQNGGEAFVEELVKVVSNSIDNEENISKIKEKFNEIIDEEDIFKFFKIFTTLKALKLFNQKENEKDNYVVELALFNLLEDEYLLNFKKLDQRKKFENIWELFQLVRKISYLLLDGYFSQNFINVNPHWLILNVDTVFKDRPYGDLMNNLNIFYTKTIYQSPENMYYHHKLVQKIEAEVFQKYENRWDNLISDIINNNLDDEIGSIIRNFADSVTNRPKHFARIISPNLERPVTLENNLFDELEGGIIKNMAANHYEIDIYFEPKCINDVFKICRVVFELYSKTKDETDVKTLIEGFEEVGEKLIISTLNTLKTSDDGINYKCNKRKLWNSSIVFCKENKEEIIKHIEDNIKDKQDKDSGDNVANKMVNRLNKGDKTELEKSLTLVKKIANGDEEGQVLYVYAPKIEALSPEKNVISECDFMLVKYNLTTSDMTLHIAEIKSRSKFEKDQLERNLRYFLLANSDELTQIIKTEASEISVVAKTLVKTEDKVKLFSKSIEVNKS